jgi:hypothetical protein
MVFKPVCAKLVLQIAAPLWIFTPVQLAIALPEFMKSTGPPGVPELPTGKLTAARSVTGWPICAAGADIVTPGVALLTWNTNVADEAGRNKVLPLNCAEIV